MASAKLVLAAWLGFAAIAHSQPPAFQQLVPTVPREGAPFPYVTTTTSQGTFNLLQNVAFFPQQFFVPPPANAAQRTPLVVHDHRIATNLPVRSEPFATSQLPITNLASTVGSLNAPSNPMYGIVGTPPQPQQQPPQPPQATQASPPGTMVPLEQAQAPPPQQQPPQPQPPQQPQQPQQPPQPSQQPPQQPPPQLQQQPPAVPATNTSHHVEQTDALGLNHPTFHTTHESEKMMLPTDRQPRKMNQPKPSYTQMMQSVLPSLFGNNYNPFGNGQGGGFFQPAYNYNPAPPVWGA